MRPVQDPNFSDSSLDEILQHLDLLLQSAVTNRHMAFHTPILMSIGRDGRPRGRTVVMRAFDPVRRSLRCHVDIRSEKALEISNDPRVGWTFYDPALKWQIRLQGVATVHHQDAVAQDAWLQSQKMSQVCYGTDPAPGSVIAGGDQFALPQQGDEIAAGQNNFAAVICIYDELEALWLGFKGHRRTRYRWNGETMPIAEWLAP
jgi:pyridoxamine 5'-phosphate oxidase